MLPQRACTLVLFQDGGRKVSQKIFLPGVDNSWCQGSPLNCPCVHQPSGLKCTTSVNSRGAFSVHVFLEFKHGPAVLQLMGVKHGYPLPPELRRSLLLRVLPNWMVVLCLRTVLLSPRSCSSLILMLPAATQALLWSVLSQYLGKTSLIPGLMS